MNVDALLKHYRAAVEDSIEYVKAQRDAAKKAGDMATVIDAMELLNKLQRTIEIADLLSTEESFRSESRQTAPTQPTPAQDGQPVAANSARPEDYQVGADGSPPRIGSGVKKFNMPGGRR